LALIFIIIEEKILSYRFYMTIRLVFDEI